MMDLDAVLDLALAEGKSVSCIGKPDTFLTRPWTDEDEQYIRDNIGRLTYEQIAIDLGRSRDAIKIRQTRKGLPSPSKRPGWLTGNQAAKTLGVDIHSIMHLAKWGCLPMEIIPGIRGILNIRIATLYRWATRPNNWIYFKVKNVRDPHLQRLVMKAQERWGDKWISIGEASKMLGLAGHGKSLNTRIHRGHCVEARWNGIWYFPLSAVERLRGTIGVGKGAGNKIMYERSRIITRADRWMLKAKHELGWTNRRIAASMRNPKWNEKSVGTRLLRLKKFEEEGK